MVSLFVAMRTAIDDWSVYKTSYDLFLNIFWIVKNFNKDYKYSLWDSIKKEMISLITNIYKANCGKDKNEFIEWAKTNIEVIRLYIRLTKDLRQISLKIFVDLNKDIESISKQLTAWEKYYKNYN